MISPCIIHILYEFVATQFGLFKVDVTHKGIQARCPTNVQKISVCSLKQFRILNMHLAALTDDLTLSKLALHV